MEQCQQCQRWSVDRNEEGDLYCMHSATCGYRRSKKDDDRMMALAQLNRQLDDEVKDVARSRDDAQRALDDLKAQLAALTTAHQSWTEVLGEWLWNCTNLLGDYRIKTVQDFNEEVNRRIAWLMQHLDYTLPPPMTEEERDRMRKLSEVNDAQRALDAERARVKELQGAASTPINELLAELISCAGVFDVSTDYEDDRKALETATQAVLDHVATLQAQLADRDAMILQMGEQAAVLAKENMAVKAQLRRVEHDAETYRKMHTVCTMNLALANNELTTLRQLVEALAVEPGPFLVQEADGDYYVDGNARFCCSNDAHAYAALLQYRATLVAQDAGKEDVSHD